MALGSTDPEVPGSCIQHLASTLTRGYRVWVSADALCVHVLCVALGAGTHVAHPPSMVVDHIRWYPLLQDGETQDPWIPGYHIWST